MPWIPPDSGFRAWTVLLASFLSTGLCLGLVNSFGIIYVDFQERFQEKSIANPSFSAALIGSLTIGFSVSLSPMSGYFTSIIGIRKTVIAGGLIAVGGVAAASFFVDHVAILCLTFGGCFGFGLALICSPCMKILGLYFEYQLSLVNSFVFAGSSVFTMILPIALEKLVSAHGIECTLKLIACCLALIPTLALSLKTPIDASDLLLESTSSAMHTSNTSERFWSSRKQLIWACIIPIALFGYYTPYFHLVKFASIKFPGSGGKFLIVGIGAGSVVGRILYGKVEELLQINGIFLQQISLCIIGLCNISFGKVSNWYWLVALALALGLFDGCLISQLEPIVNKLNGFEKISKAKVCFYLLCFLSMTTGPAIAGLLFDRLQSYELPFLVAGVPQLISAVLLNFVYLVD